MTFRVTTFGWNTNENTWYKQRTHSYQTRKAFDYWTEYHKIWARHMTAAYPNNPIPWKTRIIKEEYIDGQGWTVMEDWSC